MLAGERVRLCTVSLLLLLDVTTDSLQAGYTASSSPGREKERKRERERERERERRMRDETGLPILAFQYILPVIFLTLMQLSHLWMT
jgi:hypothetical protein